MGCVVFHKTMHTGHMRDTEEYHPAACRGYRWLGNGAVGWKREECDTVHDEWPEEALYQGVLNRNQTALEELIKRHSRELSYFIRVVLEHTGTAQDVEECTNDLFAAVWLEIESYDPARGSLRTWITMRAKYIALDRRRQIQRRQAIMMSSLESSEWPDNHQGESYFADRSASADGRHQHGPAARAARAS